MYEYKKPTKKKRVGIATLLCIVIIALFVFRLTFYTPLLLDPGRRNFVENTIDFFSCGWYLTIGSYSERYLHNPESAEKAFFKAGWHRVLFLKKYFRISDEELCVFLESRSGSSQDNLEVQLFEFCISPPISRADIFRQTSQDLWNRGKQELAVRAFACIMIANPNDPLSIFCLGFSYSCLNRWTEAIAYFQKYLMLKNTPGHNS